MSRDHLNREPAAGPPRPSWRSGRPSQPALLAGAMALYAAIAGLAHWLAGIELGLALVYAATSIVVLRMIVEARSP